MADPKVLRAIITTLEGPRWEVNRIKEWDITIDISRAANRFVLDIANVEGNYSELFDTGDKVELVAEYLNGSGRETILSGFLDDVEDGYAPEQGGTLRLDGRDNGVFILENDAIPTTHKTITLQDLASGIFGEFGIPFKYNGPTIKLDSKQIRIGQNGWDTIEEPALENDLRLYRIDNTTYLGKFQPLTDITYTFTDEPQSASDILYKRIKKRKSGASRKREIWAYGTGKGKPLVKVVDSSLPAALKRRMVITGEKTREGTQKAAKERMARNKIGSNEIEILLKGTRVVKPGRWANIYRKHGIRGINVKWIIVSVRYTCSVANGELTTVICRPIEEVLG